MAAMSPRTVARWAALGHKPAAYCGECQIPSAPERGDSGPQVIHHLASCSQYPDNQPEQPEPCDSCGAVGHHLADCQAEWERQHCGPTAASLVPGQAVHIYGGGEPVTVLAVTPVASDPDLPWVALRYQWATDTEGRPMVGVWVLPATQGLPLS